MMQGNIPSVGAIVYYTNLGDKDGKFPPEQQAAIITGAKLVELPGLMTADRVETLYIVDLHIFYKTGDFYMLDVPFSLEYEQGHWSWRR